MECGVWLVLLALVTMSDVRSGPVWDAQIHIYTGLICPPHGSLVTPRKCLKCVSRCLMTHDSHDSHDTWLVTSLSWWSRRWAQAGVSWEPGDKWGAQRDTHWNMVNILYFLLLSFYLRRPGWDVMALNTVKSDRELHCNGTTFKSRIRKSMGVELYNPSERFELNSKCSVSTPDLSVRTRFSRYKGCRAVGTKINKILNCYLPFCRGWDPAPANVQILHLAWSRKCSCWGGFREEWTAIFFVEWGRRAIQELICGVLSSAMHFTALSSVLLNSSHHAKSSFRIKVCVSSKHFRLNSIGFAVFPK